MQWDDLRVVSAVYKTGSFAAAARQLGVNETTVPRRLARLEKDLGVVLFEAVDGQRQATPACRQLCTVAETIAVQVEQASALVSTQLPQVQTRRIAATDSFSNYILAPRLPALLSAHPDLAVTIQASTSNVDFSRWQADLAIRLRRPEKGDFIVSKLMDFELFLVEPNTPEADQSPLVAYPEELDFSPESRFLKKMGLQHRVRCQSMNLPFNKTLIESGRVAGILPSYMCGGLVADQRYRLTQLPERRGAWLLMQTHLRNDKATRTVVDWVRACARAVS